MKKNMFAYIKYSRLSKCSGRFISTIFRRLLFFRKYYPSKFTSHPRFLDACSKYERAEIQFLLHIHQIIMYNLLTNFTPFLRSVLEILFVLV